MHRVQIILVMFGRTDIPNEFIERLESSLQLMSPQQHVWRLHLLVVSQRYELAAYEGYTSSLSYYFHCSCCL